MSLFPSLSTRRLPEPLLLHSSSCCPSMDVALLSNPTVSAGNASIHLYRLSGGSSGSSSASSGPIASSSSSKVWETIVEGNSAAADLRGKGKGRPSRVSPADVYIPPRLPETATWSPDGQLLGPYKWIMLTPASARPVPGFRCFGF